jgi:hypothetical protein
MPPGKMGHLAVRIIIACALAFVTTAALAEHPAVEVHAKYNYSYETRGSLHFCDLATVLASAPIVVKLTAAVITDDTKPKDKDFTVAYIVEAFVVSISKTSRKPEPRQVKVVSGKIMSETFYTDLQASKNVDAGLGASYNINSEGAFALFSSVITVTGKYRLAVEFENNESLILDVRPTPEIYDAATMWNECIIAIMEHRAPP